MPDPNHYARLYLGLVPEEVRKSISTAELNDRLVEAARLSGQATDPALSPALRQAARLRAQAVLRAQPRQHTERQHQALIAKAAEVRNPWQADAIRRQAERLIEEDHPVAPRRAAPVRKAAAAADPVPVFDADGNLIGICDPADLQPVSGAGGRKPDDAAAQQVAKAVGKVLVWDQWHRPYVTPRGSVRGNVRSPAVKARSAPAANPATPEQVIKSLGPAWQPVYNWLGRLAGAVPRSKVTPGQVLKGAAASTANVYDARGRKVGSAPLASIVPLAGLTGSRSR